MTVEEMILKVLTFLFQFNLIEFFNLKARGHIESMMQSQKISTSTLYLKKTMKNLIFVLKIQLSFPFVSFSLHWNTDLDRKDKMKQLVNNEIEKLQKNFKLDYYIYDYHISLIKQIVYKGLTGVDKLDLPLMLVHLINNFPDVSLHKST